jgi:hypothetical protein
LLIIVCTHGLILPSGVLEVAEGLGGLGHTVLLALAALYVCATSPTMGGGVVLSNDAQRQA